MTSTGGDGWNDVPRMAPEQGGQQPPPPPGQWGQGAPGQGGPGYAAPGYGAPPGYGGPSGPARNGMGVAALVLGILGLLTSWLLVGGLLGALAVIFGFVGRGRAKRGEATNGGAALAGVILGILAVLGAIAIVAAIGAVWNKPAVKDYRNCINAAETTAERDECERRFDRETGTG